MADSNINSNYTGAYKVCSRKLVYGLQKILCNTFDASSAIPFSNNKYATVDKNPENFGRLALMAYAHYLLGHVQATAAIINDKEFIKSFLSLISTSTLVPNELLNDYNRIMSINTHAPSVWSTTSSNMDANLAIRLIKSIIDNNMTNDTPSISYVNTASTSQLSNIVKKVIGQDANRAINSDNTKYLPEIHRLLPFIAGDILYINIRLDTPNVNVNMNQKVTEDTIMSRYNQSISYTLKIQLEDPPISSLVPLWGKWFDSIASDLVSGSCVDKDGNVYVIGRSQHNLLDSGISAVLGNKPSIPTIGTNLNMGVFIVKLDTNGTCLWGKWYDNTNSDDVPRSICLDNQGNLYFTLGLRSSSPFSWSFRTSVFDNGKGTNGAGIVKLNGITGTEIWNVALGSKYSDNYPAGITVDSSGNVYFTGHSAITGNSTGTVQQDNLFCINGINISTDIMPLRPSITPSGKYLYAGFLVKLNSAGNIQWGKWFDGTHNDYCTAVVLDKSEENVYVSGTNVDNLQQSIMNIMGSKPGGLTTSSVYLIKLTTNNGTIVWGKWIDSTGEDALTVYNTKGIVCDSMNNIYLLTTHANNIEPSNNVIQSKPITNSSGALLSKFNGETGNIIWGKWFDGSDSEDTQAGITLDNSENIYVIITSNYPLQTEVESIIGTFPSSSIIAPKVAVIKVNKTDGSILGGRWINNYSNTGRSICIDRIGQLYLTGRVSGNFSGDILNAIGLKSNTTDGGYIIKFDTY